MSSKNFEALTFTFAKKNNIESPSQNYSTFKIIQHAIIGITPKM
jgi:hypothetical protein